MEQPKWKRFEELVATIQRDLAGDAKVALNDKIIGKRTAVPRQIDISIRQRVAQFEVLVVIDCKDYAKPLDVKGVEEFMGLVQDVGAHRAAMVAAHGYTEAAKKRAGDAGIELYRVVDTGNHPWSATGFLPAVCVFTGVEAFSLRFASIGRFRLRTDIDHREMTLFNREGSPLGTVKDLLWHKWNTQKLPEKPGRYEGVEFVDNPVKVDTDGTLYDMNITACLTIESRLYSGDIRIEELSGLHDELKGETITRNMRTENIVFANVEKSWRRITSVEELAVRPVLTLRALDMYRAEK